MKQQITHFFRQHYLAIIFSLLVGAISVAPQFVARYSIGSDYKGIPFIYTANEDVYLARIQEILDGHFLVGSSFFYEYKNLKSLMPPTGELFFYALPIMLTGVSLVKFLIFSKFLFPAILFFLVYLLIYKLSNNPQFLSSKINALVGGLFVTLGYDLIDYKNTVIILSGKKEMFMLPLWTRPVNPVTGAILFFIFLLLLWAIIKNRRHYLFLPAGAILGLMVGYFFSWGMAMAIASMLVVIFLGRRQYKIFKNLFLTIILGLLLSLPYWIYALGSLSIKDNRATSLKNGMFFTHAPIINKVLVATALVFLISWAIERLIFKKKDTGEASAWWWFCLALIFGGFIAFNQQVLTGRMVWPYHFVQYTIPVSIVVVMVILANCLKPRFFKTWFLAAVIISGLVVGLNLAAVRGWARVYPDYRKLQGYADFFSWINKNTQKDCVILVKEPVENLTLLTPAFTHCNVYTAPWVFSGIPEDRVRHNYLARLKLNGVKPEDARDYMINNAGSVRVYFFRDWQELLSQDTSEAWLMELINELTLDYKKFIQKDFISELKKYRLDYIVTEEPLENDLAGLPFVIKLDKLYLYQL